MTKQLGWENYLRPGDDATFDLPETTLQKLADKLKDKLDGTVVRVVGKPKMKFRAVAMLPGAGGSAGQIRALERDYVDVVLAGDAVAAGKSKALILLGHANSEEAGMEHCAEWLKGFVSEVPIKFIPAGDPFWSAK
jgi:putative NIF3 family GTP cyclohydrolase 1 type 2